MHKVNGSTDTILHIHSLFIVVIPNICRLRIPLRASALLREQDRSKWASKTNKRNWFYRWWGAKFIKYFSFPSLCLREESRYTCILLLLIYNVNIKFYCIHSSKRGLMGKYFLFFECRVCLFRKNVLLCYAAVALIDAWMAHIMSNECVKCYGNIYEWVIIKYHCILSHKIYARVCVCVCLSSLVYLCLSSFNFLVCVCMCLLSS